MLNKIEIDDINLTISQLLDPYPVKIEVLFEEQLQQNCALINKVKKTGMDILVKNSMEHTCERCSLKEYIQAEIFMIKPITQNRKVIGVFLISGAEGQDTWFLDNYPKMDVKLDFCREWISNKVENGDLKKENHSILEEMNGLFSFIQDPILIVGPDGTIHNMSHRAGLEFAMSRSILMGENITEIVPHADWLKVKNSKKPQEWKISCPIKNGKQKPFTIMVKPLMTNGIVVSFLIHLNPIIDSKRKENEQRVLYTFHDVKGTSDAIQNVIDIGKRIAPSNTTVLLRGESGTGKEVFAQAIHSASNRTDGPFIALNCAAIPESLLESELFGHVKGAFTGANVDKSGRFELADGGTIFLDEIGDLPLSLQAKLLRVVQERKIERLGDTKSTPVNVRIITATHRNLEELVKSGEFREDLYYRLNVIPIMIPPLRERREDIPILIDYYLNKVSKELVRSPKRISEVVLERLLSYAWPGNIRELQNVVHHFIQLEIGDLVTIESLPTYFQTAAKKASPRVRESSLSSKREENLDEKEMIIKLLDQYGRDTFAKKKVASELNISLPTLYRRISKYKIK